MTVTSIVHARNGFDVYIGRPSKWGNPFIIGVHGSREEVVGLYRNWILNIDELLEDLPELIGKRLGCHCSPKACHGNILVELVNILVEKYSGDIAKFINNKDLHR